MVAPAPQYQASAAPPPHLAIACPSCGRPMPVNLAAPEVLRCAACGFAGVPPPAIGQRLHAARGILFGLDVRLRQLSAKQRGAIEGASNLRSLFLILSSLIAIPLAIWALAGVAVSVDDSTGEDYGVTGIVMAIGPLLSYGAISVLGYRYIRRRQRALEDACSAQPPREKGEPAACHVCGAPLAVGAQRGIVRCAFCQADNLIDPSVLSGLSGRQTHAAESIEQTIQREGRAAASVTGVTGALLLLMAAALPFLVVFAAMVVSVLLMFIELQPSLKYSYVTVTTSSGQCVARWRADNQKNVYLDFGSNPPAGMTEKQPPPEGPPLEQFRITALHGRLVRMKSGEPGRVVRSYSNPGLSTDNEIEIEPVKGGALETRKVMGVCFADEAAPSPSPSAEPAR